MNSPMPESDLLSAYLDGELSPEEREQVDQALTRSPELARELADLRALVQATRALPEVKAPSHFAEQVAKRYRRDRLLNTGLLGTFVAMPFQILSILLIAVIAAMYLSLAIQHQFSGLEPEQAPANSDALPADSSAAPSPGER